jgi:multicomponent K+:H+ antiporter subunit D
MMGLAELVARHGPVLPVLLSAITAVLLLAIGDAPARRGAARVVSLLSATAALALAVALVGRTAAGELLVYRVGDWPAPFGIALVVDRLSAWLLVLTAAVALPSLLAAAQGRDGWDTRGRHFHALFHFQLMGLNGAFVTGDLFNLFVFFEVLLIASYVLMMFGLGRERLRVGLQYVVLNLVASALFLIGVSLLYAFTGTLNLADLALRVPQVTGPEAALVQAAGLVLLVVFGFKAALMPLALWLPATYAAASPPVAALFAIMTKVGVYAILRVHGVVFDGSAAPLVLGLALATGVVGALGALAATSLPRVAAWLTVASVGTVLAAVGVGGADAWGAALYYLAHSTLVGAALFLLAAGSATGSATAAILFVVAAASAAGLPPLPGFVGKVMVLQAAAGHPWASLVWAVVLGVGFVSLLALVRAGIAHFWTPGAVATGVQPRLLAPAAVLLAAGVALSVAAAPLQRHVGAMAVQLVDRAAYARAVLPESGGDQAVTTRPYRIEGPK